MTGHDMPTPDNAAVIGAQAASHADDHDYRLGSPHLRHDAVRQMVEARLRRVLVEASAAGDCHVLEVGAGHGTFTETLLAAGARVTVSEVSEASAGHLSRRFANDPRVRVVHDRTGDQVLSLEPRWSAVVMISVLHHIPDYLRFVNRATEAISTGGAFFCAQDPIWYPRRTRSAHLASRGSYFIWRAFQGEVKRGLATRSRRMRGVYDDGEPSDLVEYHVVRNGVDDDALSCLLATRFESVEPFRYWSTQSSLGQRLGDQVGWQSDFGIAATKRR